MACGKKPGPLCSARDADPIDLGTLTRSASPKPAPVCSTRPASGAAADGERLVNAIIAIRSLLASCLQPSAPLTETDFMDAADQLGVDVEAVKAVTRIEDPNHDQIYYEGRPTILFERHHFHKYTHGLWDKVHATISSDSPGGYGKFRQQYDKLTEAYGLNASAALESVSWGKFQLLGKHYKDCGFNSVEEMVASLIESDRNQLTAFVALLRSKGNERMLAALKRHSWADFAHDYNGPAYAQNKYDVRLKAAYEKELQNRLKK
jgi:hypothetical protein